MACWRAVARAGVTGADALPEPDAGTAGSPGWVVTGTGAVTGASAAVTGVRAVVTGVMA
jgi:hypothetical protein